MYLACALSGLASPILANLSFYSYSFICKHFNTLAHAAYAQGRYAPTLRAKFYIFFVLNFVHLIEQ